MSNPRGLWRTMQALDCGPMLGRRPVKKPWLHLTVGVFRGVDDKQKAAGVASWPGCKGNFVRMPSGSSIDEGGLLS
ncbi:hypothetical protein [Phenylobacterium sp.]|uniref:hypothetical protein n=1 Tax=Phenylobacterium sp. TaxID=1871053 RepID=UPI0027347ABB|nr:hypothetical protein [Phenylobacterium sp.]